MLKNFLAVMFVFVASTLYAQTSVTVDDSMEWDNVTGASEYEAKLLDGGGFEVTINDPTTNDPDADGWVEVPSDADGVSQVTLSIWLQGQGLGAYTFRVRSVDSNGNAGASADTALSYDAPPPPTARKS